MAHCRPPPPLPVGALRRLQITSIDDTIRKRANSLGMPVNVWTLRNEPRTLAENYKGALPAAGGGGGDRG